MQLKCEAGARWMDFETDLFIFLLFIVALKQTASRNKPELFASCD